MSRVKLHMNNSERNKKAKNLLNKAKTVHLDINKLIDNLTYNNLKDIGASRTRAELKSERTKSLL